MLSGVLENAVDGILMERKRLLPVLGLKKKEDINLQEHWNKR